MGISLSLFGALAALVFPFLAFALALIFLSQSGRSGFMAWVP